LPPFPPSSSAAAGGAPPRSYAMNAVRVAVLSDNRLFCEGLLRIIGAEASFAAVGHDEEAALRPALRAARPDVLLVDSGMEGALGLCAALSKRESQIFRHAAAGLSNKELAGRLSISEATVKAHLTSIFQKLGLRGRTGLAAAYHGIDPPSPDPAAPRPDRRFR